jgi:hypothetical protein
VDNAVEVPFPGAELEHAELVHVAVVYTGLMQAEPGLGCWRYS